MEASATLCPKSGGLSLAWQIHYGVVDFLCFGDHHSYPDATLGVSFRHESITMTLPLCRTALGSRRRVRRCTRTLCKPRLAKDTDCVFFTMSFSRYSSSGVVKIAGRVVRIADQNRLVFGVIFSSIPQPEEVRTVFYFRG